MLYKSSKPTVAIVLEKRYTLNDGTHPVKLRVTYNRVQKYYSLPDEASKSGGTISLTENDFNRFYIGIPKTTEGKRVKAVLQAYEATARTIAEDLPVFSFDAWLRKFMPDNVLTGNVFDMLTIHIDRLKKEGSFSTATTYINTMGCLKAFTKGKAVLIGDITLDWLKRWKAFMKSDKTPSGKPLSTSTISIYMRCMRQIINKAITEGHLKREQYPFTDRSLIPTSRNIKKALTMEDIQKIVNYKPLEGSTEHFSRDLWLFSYLLNGANIKDIAYLKWSDINKDKVTFIRAKTRSTKETTITAILTTEAEAILNRWANPRGLGNYVFNILDSGMSAEQEFKTIRQLIKTTNKYLERIAKALEIDFKITTYSARHSYATILKRAGVPIAFISEALGHHSLNTTQNYLGSFEDEAKREHASKLLAFKTA